MRRVILAILAVLLIAPAIRGADPAPPAGAGQHPTRILVLPFSMTGADGKYAWIGQAISENYQAELAKAGFAIVNPTNPDGPVAIGDPDKALRVAQNSRAEVVIFGSYQFLDPDLRVTGQIVDVPSNQVVGVLKASGTFRQLFTIEDDLSEQAKKLLIGDKAAVAKEEVLEPRPPRAPSSEPYDTNTTAADDHREYKLPYAEQPAAYDDDYLGLGYTTYYYPAYYRPRVYSFIGYSNYGYYYPYADCYPYFFPSYCYYPRSYFGSGLFFSFSYSHWGGHHWDGWSGHHWDSWHGGNWHDGRGPRFGDRPRSSIMMVNNGPAGHDFFHGTLNTGSRFTTTTRERQTASRVINVDRERTTITDRSTGRTEAYNHAGAPLVDSTRRYSRSSDSEVATVRHPDRSVEIHTQRRADSDSRVASSDRVWDRSNPDGPRSRDTVRSREADSPRAVRDEPVRVRETPRESARETPRDTPRESSRSRNTVPSGDGNRFREPARFDPPASRSPDRGSGGGGGSVRDSSPRGGDGGSRSSGGGGGGSSRSGGGGGGGSSSGGGGHAGAGF